MNIENKLHAAFQEGLHLPDTTDFEALQFGKAAEWDSVAHLQLIAALEKEFNIGLETTDMLAINSYPKAREIVKKYLG